MSQSPPPEYTVYHSRRGLLGRRRGGGDVPDRARTPRRPGGRRIGVGRVVKWLVIAVAAWLTVSLLIFLVSAQIESLSVDREVDDALGSGGFPPFEATNVLVLGSDQRSARNAEPGSTTTGPANSDTIMLMRMGGGANARLSIARDTLVQIPGRGTQKINAAFRIGGPSLAVQTVESYTGVEIDHVILASFEDFPQLIDAMGGLTYEGGCVVGRINGGDANGGVTVRVRAGEPTELSGEEALALARTRRNECRPNENDLTRARRQQKIIGEMKDQLITPTALLRLPLIAWEAPQAVRSDMSGPTLLGAFLALMFAGDPQTRVLGTPDGNVPTDLKERAVERFLDG
ncbi:MAG TPA: LCP family protein [Solirubrobacteraceae bacterium]|nr:LCP family protein [Solirubrobacteraceae bacterium]